MKFNRTAYLIPAALLSCLIMITGSLAQAVPASDVALSARAHIPSSLSITMEGGSTIRARWIASAEAGIERLENFLRARTPADTEDSAHANNSNSNRRWTWGGNMPDLDSVLSDDDDENGLQQIRRHFGQRNGHRNSGTPSTISNPVPEPSAALVFGVGIAFVATRVRRNDSNS